MKTKLIFALFLLILVVVFTLQNAGTVPLKFITWEIEMPLALIIIITITIGIILGILFSIPGKKREDEKKDKDFDTPLE